ncbi:MAG: extracellular solute-binding protein [Chloroflexi bacterium]|nr:extracellular solute-binding protein [Chloroflexota bacterium]
MNESENEKWSPVMNRREFLRFVGGGLGVAAAGGILAACAPVATPAPSSAQPTSAPAAAGVTVAAPKATGKISVYSALNQSTNDAFFAAFKAAVPGIDVELLPLAAAGALQTRIIAEKASPKGDIFIGGDRSFHDVLGKEGLLEKYVSPNAAAIPAGFKDPNGFWTGWYVGIFAFVYNTSRLAAEMGNKVPKTWDDLLDPSWKGKIIMPSPITTGGGYVFLATQVFRFNRDEAKAMDYMKKFHANVAQYVDSAPNGIQFVAQGQFVGGPNWAHDILTSKAQGNPIGLAVIDDTGYEVGSVSIIKGGPNTAASKPFVDWMLTPEAGALNVKLSNRVSLVPGVAPAPGAPTLDSVKLVNYDGTWAGDNQKRLVQLWQKTVGM